MGDVVAIVDDLFFAAKIRGTAEQAGVPVRFARGLDRLIESILENPPSLIICDLHSEKISPTELAGRLKSDDRFRSIPLIGFFSHVQIELQQAAMAAGFDRVLPRSAFVNQLNAILSRSQIV